MRPSPSRTSAAPARRALAPEGLAALKAESSSRRGVIDLLDVLKEADTEAALRRIRRLFINGADQDRRS
ncbi:hypothetical protein HNR06_004914 [Nocardiopsis arvandica]|uniref:Uncharacterized protein n=1 Tax=Nocardiopsis sinuspersici TaxID=501010 RepID=A0A7Y9XJ00_9ACTN|nr:hypothetical protein [Nocardiopsis sinuspersici]NYH55325.1 hypothetical protein [Nocardiopsis sinuspersici]